MGPLSVRALALSSLAILPSPLFELLSLTREHVIAVFVSRECPGANVCHVLSQGSSSDAGDIGVFLYELGREGLENTEHVADDE